MSTESLLEKLHAIHFPRAKDLKAKGQTLFLCGVSDGRGKKVCNREVGRNMVPMESGEAMLAHCPKHGGVICPAPEFLSAMERHQTVVHFETVTVAHRPQDA